MKNKFLTGAFIILMSAPFFNPELRAQDLRNNLKNIEIASFNDGHPFISLNLKAEDSTREQELNKLTLAGNKQQFLKLTDSSINSNKKDSQFVKFKMKKSPGLAVLLSAILPGAGQFYNQSYWKIPIFTGLIGYFGYEYVINNNKFKDYRDQYDASITPENEFGDLNLKALREFYRNQRNDFLWYFMIVYVVNLVDAYVDAHLFDFDVKDNSLNPFAKPDRTYRLKMNLRF